MERFQMYLKEQNALGICIIDPREGQVEKSYIGPELDRIHSLLRWNENGFWQQCPNIIERVYFPRRTKLWVFRLLIYTVIRCFIYLSTTKERGVLAISRCNISKITS